MTNVPPSEVAKVFGATFGRHLDDAPLGRWSGPFASEYGLHLVLVRERTAGAVPALADVREKVLHDLLAERRQHVLDAAYQKFRARYDIVTEPLLPAQTDQGPGRRNEG